jgi:hypothetical protein
MDFRDNCPAGTPVGNSKHVARDTVRDIDRARKVRHHLEFPE